MGILVNYTSALSEGLKEDFRLSRDELVSLESAFSAAHSGLSRKRASGELPFFDLPFDERVLSEVNSAAHRLRQKFDDLVLLGIGGSALGAIALHEVLNHCQHNLLPRDKRQGCRFFCPDNVDPDLLRSLTDVLDPRHTLVNVATKSGSTAETLAEFMFFRDWFEKSLGREWVEHFVITTDPEQGFLRRYAQEKGIATFPIHPKVGGRFSVLTPAALFPAAMTGICIDEVCRGARRVSPHCFAKHLEDNPAALVAALLYLADVRKFLPIHVLFAYSNRLYLLVDWFRQLWAESLGKRHRLDGTEAFTGPTPVRALGATDQHSQVQLYTEGPRDKAVVFLGTRRFDAELGIPALDVSSSETDYLAGRTFGELLNAERRATEYALTAADRFNITIEVDEIDGLHLGALMYLLEAATLFAGAFYNVNPLDQPGVEAGKRATYALMGRKGYESERAVLEVTADKARELKIDLY